MASAARRARVALVAALREARGDVVGPDGRTLFLDDNLVDGLLPGQRARIVDELAQGDGGELTAQGEHPPKLHSAYSSAALAVNAFGRWLGNEASLDLAGEKEFGEIKFECKCPIGVRGKTPNLDLIAEGSDRVVAVESKCTEHLDEHEAKFAPVYDTAVERLAHSSWRSEYEALKADPWRYRYLNAAQLVKHYLGLKNTFADRRGALLYLYWEPVNAAGVDELLEHRREVERFSELVADPDLEFRAEAYTDLWSRWSAQASPVWLGDHVANLRDRYAVVI